MLLSNLLTRKVTPTTGNKILYSWGNSTYGQGGVTDWVQIPPTSWSIISHGQAHVLAIDSLGKLWTWGHNNHGQLGVGTTQNKSSPVQIGSSSWVAVSAGKEFSMAIRAGGTLFTWGRNDYGQLGSESGLTQVPQKLMTVEVSPFKRQSSVSVQPYVDDTVKQVDYSWSMVASGRLHSIAIRSDKKLFAWGYNGYGQLGDNTLNERSSPVQVHSNVKWKTIAAGSDTSYGISEEGDLYAWGREDYGQTGSSSQHNYEPIKIKIQNSEISIEGLNTITNNYRYFEYAPDNYYTWNYVDGGYHHTAAIRSDGKMFLGGEGSYMQLGRDYTSNSHIWWMPWNNPHPIQLGQVNDNNQQPRSYDESSWRTVSSGRHHSVAIRDDYTLWGWGIDNAGQLGLGRTDSIGTPPRQIGSSSWIAVSAGSSHTVAIRSDGALFSWGQNNLGQLGDGTTVNKSSPVQIGSSSWTAVSASKNGNFTTAIRSDGYLFTWGQNNLSQLGDGTTVNKSSPVQIGSSSWTVVYAGLSHAAAIRSGGTLFTWGHNNHGQLGDSTTIQRNSPVQIGSSSWTALAAGHHFTTALRSGGTLFTWGYNTHGEMGDGTKIAKSSPVQIGTSSWTAIGAGTHYSFAIRDDGVLHSAGLGDRGETFRLPDYIPRKMGPKERGSWVQIKAGNYHAIGLKADGTLFTWGLNGNGQLGNGTTINFSSPVQIGSSSWTYVNAGDSHSVAIRSDGALFAWGIGTSGQLGGGNLISRSSPVQIGSSSWVAAAAGLNHTIAVRNDGMLFAWGSNSDGQLGDDNAVIKPGNIDPTQSWVAISTKGSHSLAIRSDGMLYAWGPNSHGQVGDNTTIAKSSPVQIGSSSWTAVAAGYSHSLAIRSGGTLFAWGHNGNGEYGDGTTITSSSPVQIGSSSWTAITAGNATSMAIRFGGTLFTWGYNAHYQIGDGTTVNKSSPVQIGSSSWSVISAGVTHMAAIRSGGTLFTWGNSSYGEQGTNPPDQLMPVKFLDSTGLAYDRRSWVTMASGGYAAAAIDSLGRLFTWGYNNYGQLGLNDTINRSSPVQLGSSSWTAVAFGGEYVLAIRNGGTLFAWGRNHVGQLGDGTLINKSSPVQIGSSSWIFVHSNSSDNYDQPRSYAIRAGGTLFAWGYNNGHYVLGDGTTVGKSSPVQIGGTKSWTAIASGSAWTLGISNSKLYAWGHTADDGIRNYTGDNTNNYGHVSIEDSPNSQYIEKSWRAISISKNENQHYDSRMLAIDSTYKLWAWGHNSNGGLGDGTTITRTTPTQIGSSSWTAVSAGSKHTLGIRSDGALFAWGYNSHGQLGDGTTIDKSSPVQIGASLFTQIYASIYHSLAIRSAGSLFAWGYNSHGEIGDNTTISKSSPVQIGSSSWTAINAGVHHSAGIRNGGTLFTWGRNTIGQLGDGTTIDKSSPVQIGASSWTAIASGREFNLAIRSGGTLFGWGYNGHGEVGDGTTVNKSSPVQIDSNNSWTLISAAPNFSFGVRITAAGQARLYSWGHGGNIYLGFNNNSQSNPANINSTPTELTSSWVKGLNMINASGVAAGGMGQGQGWTAVIYNNNVGDTGQLLTMGTNWVAGRGTWEIYPKRVSAFNDLSKITAGNHNANIIRSNGAMYSWGFNRYGQAGIDLYEGDYLEYSPVLQVGSWAAVSSGRHSTFALRTDGTLWAWGVNQILYNPWHSHNGPQLSLAPEIYNRNVLKPTRIGAAAYGDITWTSLPNNEGNSSALKMAIGDGGRLFTSGIETYGQLGRQQNPTVEPYQLGRSSWTAVAAGKNHTIGITSGGTLYGWGLNNHGQAGDGSTTNRSSPVQLGSSSWTGVGVGDNHSHAIRSDGKLFGWGYNASAQVGDYTTINKSSPTLIAGSSWTMVSGGNSHGVGISANRALTWGLNNSNQLGRTTDRSSPVQVGSNVWVAISARRNHSAGFTTEGRFYTWGNNTFGQNGVGTKASSDSPIAVGGNDFFWNKDSLSSLGHSHNALVDSNGILYTWGGNSNSQLGHSPGAMWLPKQIGSSSWIAVSAGWTHAVAIRSDGMLFTWGRQDDGYPRVGDGTSVNKSSPVQIGEYSWSVISANSNRTLAIRSDSLLFGWGYQPYGELGDGTTISRSSPVQIGSSSWNTVSSGVNHTLGLLRYSSTQSALYAWGYNGYGQLGDSTTINKSSPVLVDNTGYWKSISAGHNHSMGLKPNDSLWTWGVNSSYELGDNTTINRSSPVQVGSSSYNMISAGAHQSFARDSSIGFDKGNLQVFGHNNYGTIGFGGNQNVSAPTPLGYFGNKHSVQTLPSIVGKDSALPGNVLRYWKAIASGREHTLAIRSDNLLFAFGRNQSGQLGIGPSVNDTVSPIQIGSSSWIAVSAGQYHSVAMRSDGALFTWGDGTAGATGDGILTEPRSIKGRFAPETSWTTIISKSNFNLAIRSDGMLFTWGYNNYGQLGDNTTIARVSPVQIGSSSWIAVAAGDHNGMAIRSGGTLFTWGYNAHGQLGDGTTISYSSPVQIGSSSWTAINSNTQTSIGIRSGGTLFTWGYNSHGQLGDNTTISKSSPVQIGSSSWTAVSGGDGQHFMAIRSGGTLFTWGYNGHGQLGDDTTISKSSPVQIGSSSWSVISAGHNQSSAIRNGGTLFTWGQNSHGAIGDNTTIDKSSPVQIGSSSWIALASARHWNTAVRSGGTLFAWGYNNYGQLGDGTTINKSSPVQIGSSSWTAVNGQGYLHSSAIRNDGTIHTWGDNTHSVLGRPLGGYYPTQITYGSSFSAITSGKYHNLALTPDGKLWGWGSGGSGQLGDGTFISRSSPVQIGSSSWTILFKNSPLSDTSYAIRSGGTLFAWGSNSNGQIGDNTTIARGSPVQVGSSSWIAVGAGPSNVLAITSGGKLFGWGDGGHGMMGEDYRILAPVKTLTGSPNTVGATQIDHSWTMLAQGDYVNAAIRSDGMLFTWGHQVYGALGLNDGIDRSSPVQVGSSSWIAVAAGRHHVAAIRNGGTLFTWGYNGNGELGDTTTISRSSPVQIGSSSWTAVACALNATSAIRSGGTLFTWGGGGHGILGDGTAISKSSPTQIGSSSWAAISMGAHHMVGLITSALTNSLYAWGHGSNGALGVDDTIDRSSPVLVSTPVGTSWSLISAGAYYTLATDQNSKLWGWGHNAHGCLGTTQSGGNIRKVPERLFISGTTFYDTSWIAIGAGRHTPYAIRDDRALFAWGYNNYGQLGDGSSLNKSIPVQIGTPGASWKAVGIGVGHYSQGAIKFGVDQFAGGQLNMAGQIATSYIGRSPGGWVPFEITTMNEKHSNWTAVGMGQHHSAALTSDNRLYVWGHNGSGQIGDGTNSSGVEQSNPNFYYPYVRGTMNGGQDFYPTYVPQMWPGSLPGVPGRWSDFALGYSDTKALTVDI